MGIVADILAILLVFGSVFAGIALVFGGMATGSFEQIVFGASMFVGVPFLAGELL